MAKQGSTVSGLMDAFATSISIALQYGVPLATLVDKFSHLRFEPAGFTNNPKIPMAKSVMDYIFRWLSSRFTALTSGSEEGDKALHAEDSGEFSAELTSESFPPTNGQEDAPICSHCGDVMVRNGSCYKCSTCGETSGCS
jgi:ribonucleoside-diphosphate reductase alpha chain